MMMTCFAIGSKGKVPGDGGMSVSSAIIVFTLAIAGLYLRKLAETDCVLSY